MPDPKRVPPAIGQESVWDYPRPPRCEASDRHLQVWFNGLLIADSRRSYRVLETSHPPVYYIPPEDIRMDLLLPNSASSYCEWKGSAAYYDIVVGDRQVIQAGWYYPDPTSMYRSIRNFVAFYAGKMDRCTVDGEVVQPQPGGFYGGWITQDIVGPFKGMPGTMSW